MSSAARSNWPFLVGGLLLGLLAAWGLLQASTPQYESTTRLFVSIPAEDGSSALDGGLAAQQRIASYAEILTSRALTSRVVEDLDLDLSPAQVAERVNAVAVTNTSVLELSVRDGSPERARDMAASLADQFSTRIAEFETGAPGADPAIRAQVIDPPLVDDDPVSPGTARALGLGGVLGLLAGLAAALVRSRRDTSVRDGDDVTAVTGAELIGITREDPSRERSAPVSGRPSGEFVRAIAAHLHLLDAGRAVRVVAVTSPVAVDGRTTLALDLASALADSGHRVVLVETDLRHPSMAGTLGLAPGPRLGAVLAGDVPWREALQPWNGELAVLPAGPPADHPPALRADELRTFLHELRETHDFVVLDTPPLLAAADAATVSALADGCVLTVRYGATRRAQLGQAAALLARLDARVLGVVLTRVPRAAAARAGYAYASAPRVPMVGGDAGIPESAPAHEAPRARHGLRRAPAGRPAPSKGGMS